LALLRVAFQLLAEKFIAVYDPNDMRQDCYKMQNDMCCTKCRLTMHGSCLTIAFCLAMMVEPIASTMVTSAGSPAGIIATAIATAVCRTKHDRTAGLCHQEYVQHK
jgi:hypothetical protein